MSYTRKVQEALKGIDESTNLTIFYLLDENGDESVVVIGEPLKMRLIFSRLMYKNQDVEDLILSLPEARQTYMECDEMVEKYMSMRPDGMEDSEGIRNAAIPALWWAYTAHKNWLQALKSVVNFLLDKPDDDPVVKFLKFLSDNELKEIK